MTKVLAIISSILAIVMGLWKKFWGDRAMARKKKEEAYDKLKEAKDASDVNSIIDDINNAD